MSKKIKNLVLEKQKVAKWLLDINAVNFRPSMPYNFTSGWVSPVYIDCRWIISFLHARRYLIDISVELLEQKGSLSGVDMIAGGETAGIPYAAWISEKVSLPMLYVRKKPKGFGTNAQIEGNLKKGSKVLLVEDLATDGGSKINFVKALREAGGKIDDVFALFFYDIFPGSREKLEEIGIRLHYLCTWRDILDTARQHLYFDSSTIGIVEEFLDDPISWSGKHGGRDSID